MNGLHDLLEKIKKIEETPTATTGTPPPAAVSSAPAAPAPAAPANDFLNNMKNYEAEKAKAALATKLQAMLLKRDDPNTKSKGYFIDPTNGLIGWASPYGGAPDRPELLRFDQVSGIHKDIKNLLDSAGVKIVSSQPQPGFTGYAGGYASVPMDQVKLLQSGKLPQPAAPAAVVPPAPAPAPAPVPNTGGGDAQKTATNAFQPKIDRLKTILGLNVTKEGIVFKSSIGRLLAEEFGVLEAEVATNAASLKKAQEQAADTQSPRAEADAIWAELTKAMETPGALTPEQRKDVENMTQAFQQFQQNNPLPQPATPTVPTEVVPSPEKKKPKYLVNPGTRALQHWLNSKGAKVTVDGALGPETTTARQAYFDKYIAGGKADKATTDEYFDMAGVGVAYNVKPTKTDTEGYMWIGSKRYLEAMKKYGYDPKTGNPVGGNSQKIAPSSSVTSQFPSSPTLAQPKTIEEYDAAIKAVTDKLTQLYKADPNSAETKAANAELMKLAQGKSALMNAPAQQTGGAAAYTETPEYKKLLANLQSAYKVGPESPAYKKAMADLEAYTKAQTPAPVVESGFANEELSRILSLVHHR